jgi:hypothetical protein
MPAALGRNRSAGRKLDVKMRAAAGMLVDRRHGPAKRKRLPHGPAPSLLLGGSRQKYPRPGPQLAAQLSPPGSGLGGQPLTDDQRAPLVTRRQWPDQRLHPADKERLRFARSDGCDIGAPIAPEAAARAYRATAPAGVQPANPDAADSAIDQNSQFAKLVHALPQLCHRTIPEVAGDRQAAPLGYPERLALKFAVDQWGLGSAPRPDVRRDARQQILLLCRLIVSRKSRTLSRSMKRGQSPGGMVSIRVRGMSITKTILVETNDPPALSGRRRLLRAHSPVLCASKLEGELVLQMICPRLVVDVSFRST